MRLLITLVVVAVLSWALARPLCSHSMLFYLAAVALAGAGAYLTIAPPAVLPLREVAFVVQKGYVAFALFAVVMMMCWTSARPCAGACSPSGRSFPCWERFS